MTINKKPNLLAIVIPAYKARFLRQALESIAQQTDKRFTVYVGDDASPDNIKEICDDFMDRFDLMYTRFDENLGHKSLVAQWNRCIDISSEPWIWVFCDDDIMEPECVDMFYETIEHEKAKFQVLRFNTLTIDDDSQIIAINPPHPLTESGGQFIYHRLRYERASYVSEYIFSRKSYLKNEGIIDFPMAYCSDDASWIAFSEESGILTIQGANVYWRRSSENICPSGAKYQAERIEAAFLFINWLNDVIKSSGTGHQHITREIIRELSKSWFLRQVRGVAPITLSNFPKSARLINIIMQKGWLLSYGFLLTINLNFYWNTLRKLKI